MNEQLIEDSIKVRITQQLYKHAPSAIFASIFNAVIVFIVFRNIIHPFINFGWTGVCILFLLWRYFFTREVLRKKIDIENFRKRLLQFGVTMSISGILIGSSGILYLSLDRPAYNAFIFFLMGGIFAGALGAFAIEKRIFAAFSIPIIFPVTIHSFILGGEMNTAMAIMGINFIVMMIILVLRMNTTMVSAFRLDIQNMQLANDTQRLNQELLGVNEKLRLSSLHDTLTSAANRRFVTDILQNEIDRFAFTRKKSLVSNIKQLYDPEMYVYGLLIIDIDHFKDVNDSWGHKYGDALLIQFVNVLKSLVRKNDVVTRWGGEEFVVILKDATSAYLDIFACKVIKTISSKTFELCENRSIKKTCSLGFVEFPFIFDEPDALTLQQTIDIADKALYHAKANGRNQAVRATYNSAVLDECGLNKADLIKNDMSMAVEKKYIQLIRVT